MLTKIEPNDDINHMWKLRNNLISAAKYQYRPDELDESVTGLINIQNYDMACCQADLLFLTSIQRNYGDHVRVKIESDTFYIYKATN